MEESETEQFSFPLTSFSDLSVKEANKTLSRALLSLAKNIGVDQSFYGWLLLYGWDSHVNYAICWVLLV